MGRVDWAEKERGLFTILEPIVYRTFNDIREIGAYADSLDRQV